MTWLLVPLVILYIAALFAHTGYTMGYYRGWADKEDGRQHCDDRPSWWRRFLDLGRNDERTTERQESPAVEPTTREVVRAVCEVVAIVAVLLAAVGAISVQHLVAGLVAAGLVGAATGWVVVKAARRLSGS